MTFYRKYPKTAPLRYNPIYNPTYKSKLSIKLTRTNHDYKVKQIGNKT